jgi:hypothetical protein
MRTTLVTATASLLLILAGVPGVTLAQIWINGQLVQGAELDQLQAIYGEPIPAGRYWLGGNGDWGYEGSYQVMGNLYTDNRNAPSGDSANSGGAWVDNHGSSGSIMRDENGCMYFSGGGVSGSTC